jgi:hypothetical protein
MWRSERPLGAGYRTRVAGSDGRSCGWSLGCPAGDGDVVPDVGSAVCGPRDECDSCCAGAVDWHVADAGPWVEPAKAVDGGGDSEACGDCGEELFCPAALGVDDSGWFAVAVVGEVEEAPVGDGCAVGRCQEAIPVEVGEAEAGSVRPRVVGGKNGEACLPGENVFGEVIPSELKTAHLFRARDGRLCEHWGVRDELDVLYQLGALHPPIVTVGNS